MQDTANQGQGRRPWIKPLLLVSLAVNLAVLGIVAGAFWRFEGDNGRRGGPPALADFGKPYIMAFEREDRRAVLQRLRAQDDNALPDRAGRRALYTDVLASLRSEPFDPETLRQAVTRQAQTSVTVQRRVQAAWLAHISAMEPADRQAYANAVEDMLRRGSRRDPSSRGAE